VSVYLWQPHRESLTRDIVDVACGFVETMLKRRVRTNVFERLKEALPRRPMGDAIHQLVKEKHLQTLDASNLHWLTDKVYNSMHEREPPSQVQADGREVEHYFSLEEAMAVYLIARKLAWRLFAYSGKPPAVFSEDLAKIAR
jgi:hypothetical protein